MQQVQIYAKQSQGGGAGPVLPLTAFVISPNVFGVGVALPGQDNYGNDRTTVSYNFPLLADGVIPDDLIGVVTNGIVYGFNGHDVVSQQGYDRIRSSSADNLNPAIAKKGSLLVSAPGSWSQVHEPAANVQATTTKAAAAATRHVCTGIAGSLMGVAAIAAPLYLRLRDGATGAGTILWSQGIIVPAGTCAHIELTGLNVVGSVNTAMTLEWSAAPGATNFESVALSGYDVA